MKVVKDEDKDVVTLRLEFYDIMFRKTIRKKESHYNHFSVRKTDIVFLCGMI